MTGAADPDRVLTPDEVAQRLDRAVFRALRVLVDVRQTPGLYDEVRRSRHLSSLGALRDEVAEWFSDDEAQARADVARVDYWRDVDAGGGK